jgi:hypothetical protein
MNQGTRIVILAAGRGAWLPAALAVGRPPPTNVKVTCSCVTAPYRMT